MSSSADIVASMRSLDLGRSPDSSSPKTESSEAKNKTTSSQQKPKLQPAKSNPITIPKKPSGSHPPKSQPPKSQAERPAVYPVYTPLGPPPRFVNQADGEKTYQFQARAEPGAVPTSPKKTRKNPRNRTQRSNSAPITTQAVPRAFHSLRQPTSGPVPPKSQPTSPVLELTEKVPQQTFKYVVQASGGAESSGGIVGVYSELERANESAKIYVGKWGVGKSDIVDIQSSFGCKARASRRSWQGGMSEIRVGWAWVKVLPKEFITSDGGDKKTYLAVDRSDGLFIIGVFAEKEPAWEACKKYRDQLAYCSELEEKEQWFDEEGMFHSKGKIGGKVHHWSVVEYPLDENVE